MMSLLLYFELSWKNVPKKCWYWVSHRQCSLGMGPQRSQVDSGMWLGDWWRCTERLGHSCKGLDSFGLYKSSGLDTHSLMYTVAFRTGLKDLHGAVGGSNSGLGHRPRHDTRRSHHIECMHKATHIDGSHMLPGVDTRSALGIRLKNVCNLSFSEEKPIQLTNVSF